MKTWIIEPRDSLIVRDGRPFGLGGIRATSLDFPFPSTITGGVRTRAGLNNGMFDSSFVAAVKEIATAGPLLVELNASAEIDDWLMLAPADALLEANKDVTKARIKRLAPIDPSLTLTNIDNGLLPVGITTPLKGKPLANAPRFWYWTKFRDWLIESKDFSVELKNLGHNGPEKDSRVHASLNEFLTTGTTGENNLFQTRGLEFKRILEADPLSNTRRLALAIFVQDSGRAQMIRSGLASLGGERRLVAWREDRTDKGKDLHRCPNEIKEKIKASGCCRLVLLTPAFFQHGFYPDWILQTRQGITPVLKAIALNHYQVVSGWDFAKVQTKDDKQIVGEPKPTRRLVPSGAVLFLELGKDQKAISDWIDEVWFTCISDDDPPGPLNPRSDGFGLAMLGTWDGIPVRME